MANSDQTELIIEAGRTESQYWKDLYRYRELFCFLSWRDILVRYKQTVIGVAWAVLRPFLTKSELLSGINQEPLLVNFFGHGSIEIWRGILTLEDIESLSNGFRLPIFVNMTCLNGFFQNPYSETLAEGLMKAKGEGL